VNGEPANYVVTKEKDMESGFFETLGGVITRPISTIRSICEQRPIGWAIIVVLVVSVITTIGMDHGTLEALGVAGLGVPAVAALFFIINLISLLLLAAIYHLAASFLGGNGTFRGLFCGSAFAAMPGMFAAPLALIGLLSTVGAVISGLGSFGIVVWSLVLGILAVRENYLISTGRAVLIYLLAPVVAAVAIFFVVMFAVLLVSFVL